MAELADALDLGSSAARLAGSTPVTRTIGESVRTIRTYIYESIRNDWFFRVLEKIKKFYNYSTRNINLQGDYRVEIKSHNDKKIKNLIWIIVFIIEVMFILKNKDQLRN